MSSSVQPGTPQPLASGGVACPANDSDRLEAYGSDAREALLKEINLNNGNGRGVLPESHVSYTPSPSTSPRKRTWLAAGFTMDGASGPHKTPKSTRVSPVRNIMTTSPVGRLLNSSPLKPDQTNRLRQHGSVPRRLSHKKLTRPSLYGVRPEDMPLLYSLRKKVDGSLANDYAGNFEAALKLRISRVVETMVYNGTPRYPEHIIQAELERIDMEEARKAMAEDGKDLFENQVAEAVNANRLIEEPTQHQQKNAACL